MNSHEELPTPFFFDPTGGAWRSGQIWGTTAGAVPRAEKNPCRNRDTAKKRRTMTARRLAAEAAENLKKWTAEPPAGLDGRSAARGSLAGLPVTTARCPIQGARVPCYLLECSHHLGRDAAHIMLEETAFFGRPAVTCPVCSVVHPIACQCIACDGWRPFAWSCQRCAAPHCASCVVDGCAECCEPFA
jgi:hypothetical protein